MNVSTITTPKTIPSTNTNNKKGGKVKKRLIEAPTLHPSDEEFNDPIGYLSRPEIVQLAENYGILKIVPPRGWKPPFCIDKDSFKFHTRLQNLKELNLENRPKIFFLESLNNFLNMKKKKQIDITEGEDKIILDNNLTIDLYMLFQITDHELNLDNGGIIEWNKINQYFNLPIKDTQLKKIYEHYLEGYSKYLKHAKPLLSKKKSDDEYDNEGNCMICYKNDDPRHTLICDGCEETYHMKCLNPPLKTVPKNDWYCDNCLLGTFDYGFEEDFDSLFTINEFQDICNDFEKNYFLKHFNTTQKPSINLLEKEFWRLVDGKFLDQEDEDLEIRYGADIHSDKADEISGFPTIVNPKIDINDPKYKKYINHPFNLTNLPFSKGSLLNYIKDKEISGMTVPWIYVGSLFSTFCWHKEDHYTLSSNYCYFGATKKWYGVPAKYESLFEEIMINSSPEYFRRQPDLLHQLVTLLSPETILEKAGDREITIVQANQNENEFIVTFPKVYHAGFNCGLNFNEAVNFTMPYWIKDAYGAIASYKQVGKENVFNYYRLLERILKEFQNIPIEEIYKNEKRYNGGYLSMIKISIKDFSNEYNKNFKDFEKLNKNDLISSLQKLKYTEPESQDEDLNYSRKRKRRNRSYKNEDELLCAHCKSYINFKWIELNNNIDHHINLQLHTPDATPAALYVHQALLQRTKNEEAEFQRIIKEAKRLAEITENEEENLENINNSNQTSSRESSVMSSNSTSSDNKVRKSKRLKKLEGSETKKLLPSFSEEEEESRMKKKTKNLKNKLYICVDDFLKILNEDDKDFNTRILRNFQVSNVTNLILKKTKVYYSEDDDTILRFINDINNKFEKIVGKNDEISLN
ncbi:hypothetical protein PACTADRAFT_51616 [Pachysolen tannophilus NRRL Y-2460]|uniref:Histone demethylase JHD2 n=1 Tax=Pachysolen tannophilus NRRL Y-2460 TaxID=669874 RepID=A0A1E4TQ28_PACTA|nr:hypothetical protein PACTADRAFT_51616 [Pachysolen tannophilus NRRL Y-2460]